VREPEPAGEDAEERAFEAFLQHIGEGGEAQGLGLQGEGGDCGLPPFEDAPGDEGLGQDFDRHASTGSLLDSGAGTSRSGDGEASGGEKVQGRGKRAARRRTPHQLHLNKLCQKRYRERQRDRRAQLEEVATRLEERTALYDTVDRENGLLREANERLAALVTEQQAIIDRIQGEAQQARSHESLVRQLSDPGFLSESLQAPRSKISAQAGLRSAGQGHHSQQLGVHLGHNPSTSGALEPSMPPPLPPAWGPSPFASGSHDIQQLLQQQQFGPSTSPSSTSGIPAGRMPTVHAQGRPVSAFDAQALQEGHGPLGAQYINVIQASPKGRGTTPQWGFLGTGQPGGARPSNPDLGALLRRTREQLSLAPGQGFMQGLHEELPDRPRGAASGFGAPPLLHLPGTGAGTNSLAPGFDPSLPQEGSISSSDVSTGATVSMGGLINKMGM